MALAGITGLALITTVSPAEAARARPRPKPPALTVSGGTTWEERVNGDAVVTGPADVMFRNSDETISAQLAAVVSPSDHTLPEPETCETAISTITVFDARRVGMTLIGVGEVCGFYPQLPTSAVTHVFTGRYEVLEAKRHNLVGTDGFFEVRLGVDGASAFAIDT